MLNAFSVPSPGLLAVALSGKRKMRSAYLTHFRRTKMRPGGRYPLYGACFVLPLHSRSLPFPYRCLPLSFIIFPRLKLLVLYLDTAELLHKPLLGLYQFQNNFALSVP